MAPKTVPRRVQDEVKIIAKFWSLSGTVLGRFLTPSWAPRRLQNRPKIRPRAFKIPPRISKTTRGPPRSLQTPPGPPRDLPRTPHRDRKMTDFGLILQPIWGQILWCSNLQLGAFSNVAGCFPDAKSGSGRAPNGKQLAPRPPLGPPKSGSKASSLGSRRRRLEAYLW